MLKLTWNDIDRMTRELCNQLVSDGFAPQIIVAVQRGGLPIAVHLSHLLNVFDIIPLSIRTMDKNTQTAKSSETMIMYQNYLSLCSAKQVLLVDEVADTGHTIEIARNLILGHNPTQVKTLVIADYRSHRVYQHQPDYSALTIDTWTVFPWEE